MKITIAGGSIGGLCAGIALRGIGADVQIFERESGPMDIRGAGIVVQLHLTSLLREHHAPELPVRPAKSGATSIPSEARTRPNSPRKNSRRGKRSISLCVRRFLKTAITWAQKLRTSRPRPLASSPRLGAVSLSKATF
jgi:flavin-dependent dehydrogenase